MTDPARRDRAATRWRRLAVILAAVVLLAGCELATGVARTVAELREAGIRNPNLQYRNGVATLEYDADPNPLEARVEQGRAASVIWRNLPFRIDRISVSSRGDFPTRRDYPRALLERELGPRPANLDRSMADIARRAVLFAVLVAGLLLVAVVLIIVLVVRAVRRRPPPQPAGWPQAGPQQPLGQQPGDQPTPPGQGWPQPHQPPPPPAEPPARGPGDTQRLDPGPPSRGEQGPVPPA